MRRNALSCRHLIGSDAVGIFAVPVRRNPEADWPVGRVFVDGRIAVVAHLVPVVLKDLAEIVQLGPSLVARRARHAELPRKGGDGGARLGERNDHRKDE